MSVGSPEEAGRGADHPALPPPPQRGEKPRNGAAGGPPGREGGGGRLGFEVKCLVAGPRAALQPRAFVWGSVV